MKLTASRNAAPPAAADSPPAHHLSVRTLFSSWELYAIVLVASFLRFDQINATQFMEDQATVFSLAHDAVVHGLIPITSNAASVGIANPPGVIYFLMLPALFSPDPVWGAIQVGLFSVAAVVLTYLFTRRYYGRFAGVVAALLYATASKPLEYARAIWQQNLMAPFLVLFMCALFWGVVERRRGWFAPAVLLLGILFQLHESSALLVVPLLLALVLSPRTLRWRDLVFALLALAIIYFPWFIWEIHNKYADILSLFSLSKQQAHIDNQAISYYLLFLSPYNPQLVNSQSFLAVLAPWLNWLGYVLPVLLVGGIVTAILLIMRPQGDREGRPIDPDQGNRKGPPHHAPPPLPLPYYADAPPSYDGGGGPGGARVLWWGVHWWTSLRANPYASGLLVLLAWQIVPLVVLSRHAIDLQPHYFLFLMPGPFILIGLLLGTLVEWAWHRENRGKVLRYGISVFTGLLIGVQLVGTTASVIDISNGHFDDRSFYSHYRSDLASLQHALATADQVAQQRHLNHVYVATDDSTAPALRYLSEQMRTPTTLFDTANCLVLPDPAAGPAALLIGPYDTLTNALLSQYAAATLVDSPQRPGGAPFKVYIVTPAPVQPTSTAAFVDNLQLLSVQVQHLTANSSWLVTRWGLLRSAQPALRTDYTYSMTAQPGSGTRQNAFCTLSAMRPGDQLLVAFNLPAGTAIPSVVTLTAAFSMKTPYNPTYGPFHFETYIDHTSPALSLKTKDGATNIVTTSS